MTPRIRQIAPERYEVESFSQRGTFYEVDTRLGSCTCPAFTRGFKQPCKHLAWVREYQAAPGRRR